MNPKTYHVGDRRPIAARDKPFFQRIAGHLAARGASANAISVAGAACGVASGITLAATSYTQLPPRALWLGSALLIQLRLQGNLLDGMVAVARGKASAVGELYNDLPDRISDSATLIGLGYAAGANPTLGWLAALLAMLTAYVRVLGKSAGAKSEFVGPMAKQHRMAIVTVLCCFIALTPASWQQWRPIPCVLAIIILGSAITAIRRLLRVATTLKGTP